MWANRILVGLLAVATFLLGGVLAMHLHIGDTAQAQAQALGSVPASCATASNLALGIYSLFSAAEQSAENGDVQHAQDLITQINGTATTDGAVDRWQAASDACQAGK